MQQRFDLMKDAPDVFKPLLALETAIRGFGIEPHFVHLIRIRASQMNGCAYCVDMHIHEAQAAGMAQQWIDLLCAWRESPLYDDRERAVLNLVEEVTNVSATHISDAAYAEVRRFFDVPGTARLLVAISMINAWNRLSLAQRLVHPVRMPGTVAA